MKILLTPKMENSLKKLKSIEFDCLAILLRRLQSLKDGRELSNMLPNQATMFDDDIWVFRVGEFRLFCTVSEPDNTILLMDILRRRGMSE